MIDPATSIGAVHLRISDLDRSIRFYERHLGFITHDRTASAATLGAGEAPLLVLEASPSARRVQRTTGLYHFAILVPSRLELARSLRRLVDTDTAMQGYADHGVSEALYLADPDGNGIEVYRDRPKGEWPMVGGRLRMGADPLDFEGVLGELKDHPEPTGGLTKGTIIGHVHLHVAHLPDAEHFYVTVLGFDLMQRYGRAALFVSAGGYHHHIGLNTWAGEGAPPPPADAIGLQYYVVRVISTKVVDDVARRLETERVAYQRTADGVLVRDPAENAILIRAGDA